LTSPTPNSPPRPLAGRWGNQDGERLKKGEDAGEATRELARAERKRGELLIERERIERQAKGGSGKRLNSLVPLYPRQGRK